MRVSYSANVQELGGPFSSVRASNLNLLWLWPGPTPPPRQAWSSCPCFSGLTLQPLRKMPRPPSPQPPSTCKYLNSIKGGFISEGRQGNPGQSAQLEGGLLGGHPQAILPLSSSHLPPAHTQVLSRCPPGALPGFRSPAPPPCLPLLCCVHRLQAPDGNHLAQYAGLSLRAVEDTGRGLKWDPAHSCHGVKGGTLVT